MSDQQSYDMLSIDALVNILVNPDSPADAHEAAFRAFCNVDSSLRQTEMTKVLRAMVRHAHRYNSELMMDAVEILATDPDSNATATMIEVLPDVLQAGMTGKNDLTVEFREYFYQAVVTRAREDDLTVWSEMLPKLDGRTLVAALLDPAAGALKDIEPMTLMSRLPDAEKSRSFASLIVGLASKGVPSTQIREVASLLRESASDKYAIEAADLLIARWEKLRKAGHTNQAQRLEAALKVVDPRPRTASEKLLGKRPWAN